MAQIAEKKIARANSVKQAKKETMYIKRFRLLLLGLLSIIIFYPPFLRGLYFEDEQLPTEIFVFVIYIAFLVYKYLKNDQEFIKTPLEYVSIGFVLVYFISIFTAVGIRESIGEWLKYCMFFAVFIMLSELLDTYNSKIFALWTIVASALGVSFIGIDGVAGSKIATVLNNLFKGMGSDHDVFYGIFVGKRINSTFQYPNATAAYLMAVFFVTVILTMVSRKTMTKLISSLSSYIILITFMLTLSRGAMIFFPVAAVIFVVLQAKGNKIKSILYSLPPSFAVLITLTKLTNFMANPEGKARVIWLYVLAGTAITAILQISVQFIYSFIRKLKESDSKGYKAVRILGYSVSIIVILLSIAGTVVVITTDTSLVLTHLEGQADSTLSVRRSFKLEPGKEYQLVYSVQAENSKMKPNAYSITVASRDFSGIINGNDSKVISIDGKVTSGFEQKELKFKVPSNSRAMSITFSNYFEGTKAEFKDVKIVSLDHENNVRSVAVKYKFIPESIIARIDEAKETRSGIERVIFAKDGFKIFRDHIVTGGGGGSWQLLYFSHQSYFYETTQAHNYPVQVVVETGILGILVLGALYAALLFTAIWTIKAGKKLCENESVLNAGLTAACTSLILHSCMDFDLSLTAIYLVLWQLLAVINSSMRNYQGAGNSMKTESFKERYIYQIKSVKIHPIICILVVSVIVIFPILFNEGLSNVKKSVEMQIENNQSQAIKYMEKAVISDPLHAVYKADYINILISQESNSISQKDIQKANQYALSIEKSAETNAYVAAKLGSYYWATAVTDKALYFFDKATQLRPLNAVEWQNKAFVNYQLGVYFKDKGTTAEAEKYFNKVLHISEEVKKVNSSSMIPFTMTPSTMELIEKVRILHQKENSLRESIAARSVFYSINDMDVDGNGIPDGWNDTNTNEVKLQVSDNKLIAEAQNGLQGILQSRKIILQPEKTYVISVELENFKDVSEIAMTLSGQKESIQLVKSGSNFTKEISTGAGGSIEPLSLGIVVNGRYVLKDVRVVEK